MSKAFNSALRLLSRREHGAIELCDKLKQRGFSRSEAEDALSRCQELDLQSDSRFVGSYSRSRIRQGYGPLKIAQELKTRGIDPDLIQSGLDEERDNWFDYALSVWQKKGKGQCELSFSDLQKQQRFLLYRGFSMDIIEAVVKEMKSTQNTSLT